MYCIEGALTITLLPRPRPAEGPRRRKAENIGSLSFDDDLSEDEREGPVRARKISSRTSNPEPKRQVSAREIAPAGQIRILPPARLGARAGLDDREEVAATLSDLAASIEAQAEEEDLDVSKDVHRDIEGAVGQTPVVVNTAGSIECLVANAIESQHRPHLTSEHSSPGDSQRISDSHLSTPKSGLGIDSLTGAVLPGSYICGYG